MKRFYLFDENNEILLLNEGTSYSIPTEQFLPQDMDELADLLRDAHSFAPDEYVCRINNARLRTLLPHRPEGEQLYAIGLRTSARFLSPADYDRAGKASELLYWSEHMQYCNVCGAPMQWHSPISRSCQKCGLEIWPQLNTAIIVLVHKGDKALLVKAKSFRRDFFGLVAGFVETGESLEQCVAREVMEETSLQIGNIRYFGSQPWPYPLGLMVGFHADYVSGDIKFADGELKDGRFFGRDELPLNGDGTPAIPGPESMARRLIDDWMGEMKNEK